MADDWHERDRLVEYSEDAQRGFRPLALRKPDSTCSRLCTRCNIAVGLFIPGFADCWVWVRLLVWTVRGQLFTSYT